MSGTPHPPDGTLYVRQTTSTGPEGDTVERCLAAPMEEEPGDRPRRGVPGFAGRAGGGDQDVVTVVEEPHGRQVRQSVITDGGERRDHPRFEQTEGHAAEDGTGDRGLPAPGGATNGAPPGAERYGAAVIEPNRPFDSSSGPAVK